MAKSLNTSQNSIENYELTPQKFFDLSCFEHRSIFEHNDKFAQDIIYVWDALKRIKDYFNIWEGNYSTSSLDKVSPLAYLENTGNIFIGKGTIIEPGAYIVGPSIIGKNCVIRHGAYIRGNVIMGDNVILGHASEAKNAIFLNGAQAPHFAYVGDSILGNKVNLGAGTKLSNLTMVSTKDAQGKRPSIKILVGNHRYDTGLTKIGAILGDFVQCGCNVVLNPGCIVDKYTLVYPNISLRKGYYESYKIIKLRQTIEIDNVIID